MSFIRKILIASVLLLAYCIVLFAITVPYGWIGLAVIAVAMMYKRGRIWTAHGTARWAQMSELQHLLYGSGLIVGHIAGRFGRMEGLKALCDRSLSAPVAVHKFLQTCQPAWRKQENLVRLTDAVHVSIYGPSGSGKGRSCILPFLLTCPESCVIVDPKGENYERTAEQRRKMGQRVVRIDPFAVCGPGGDKFNPLGFITDARTAVDACRDLAEALVVRTGHEKEAHWADAAEIVLTAMIAAAVAFGEDGQINLSFVRELVADQARMQAAIQMLTASDDWSGMLKRLGLTLSHFKEKELGSVMTTTNRFLRFLDSIPVSECVNESTFDPADLCKGRTTVFLILPFEHLRTQSALVRMWIGSMLRAVVQGGLQQKNRVHFVIDEAAALGNMGAIEDALDKYRGYGVRLQLYYQSLGQLKKCWPDGADQTLLSNTTQVFFAVNDHATAEYVSNRLGEGTIIVESGGTSTGTSSQRSGEGKGSHTSSYNSNDNWGQAARKLLKPEEVTALDPRIAITLHPGVRPIATYLCRYDEGIRMPRRIGPVKATIDALCLFALAAMLAVGFTAIVFNLNQR